MYALLRQLIRWGLTRFFAFEVDGAEFLPETGPFILAGNHEGFLDSLMLMAANDRQITFLAAKKVFDWPVVGPLMKLAGMVPVDVEAGKGRSARSALKSLEKLVELLKQGRCICIFPEGRLTIDGQMHPFQKGVVYLQQKSQAPIVPFAIYGGFEAWRWGQPLPKRHAVKIQFGQPVYPRAMQSLPQAVSELDDLFARVQFMKDVLDRRSVWQQWVEERDVEEVERPDSGVLRLVQIRSDRFGGQTALSMRRGEPRENRWEVCSYAELSRRARDGSCWLLEQGLKPGDRVILLGGNSPDWVIAFFASVHAGAIVVPLDLNTPLPELKRVIEDCQPAAVFMAPDSPVFSLPETQALLTPIGCKVLLPATQSTATVSAGIMVVPEAFMPLWQLQPQRVHSGVDRSAGADFLLLYRSPKRGLQKNGIVLSFKSIVYQARVLQHRMSLKPNEAFLSTLPLSHPMELVGGLLSVLYAGGRIYYTPPEEYQSPYSLLRLVHQKQLAWVLLMPERVEALKAWLLQQLPDLYHQRSWRVAQRLQKGLLKTCLPQALRQSLLRRLFGKMTPLKPLLSRHFRGILTGGAPLSAKTVRFFQTLGVQVYQGYGLAEAGPVISLNTPTQNRPGSVGKPLPGVSVKIVQRQVSQQGNRQAQYTQGHICVQGPQLMNGYYQRPSLTYSRIDLEGWLHTDDEGWLDEEGYLYIASPDASSNPSRAESTQDFGLDFGAPDNRKPMIENIHEK